MAVCRKSVTYTVGRLRLNSRLEGDDRESGRDTRGRFDKWSLDVARVQSTPVPNLILFGRVSSQWAGKNLDSSEAFGPGGPNGVRAYPTGEGFGDTGWLAQLELRYTMGAFSPYVFHDSGRVKVNAKPPTSADNIKRSISGSGVGVRYQRGDWNLDTAVAWRTHGGKPESDTRDRNPRWWATLSYRF